MIKPDVILVTPSNFDFPYWRWWLDEAYGRFDTIVNVSIDAPGYSFAPFVLEQTGGTMINLQAEDKQTAIELALAEGHNPWLLFVDHGFCPDNPAEFFNCVCEKAENYDAIGKYEASEFLLVRREPILNPRTATLQGLETPPYIHYADVAFNWQEIMLERKATGDVAAFKEFIIRSLEVATQRHPEYERIAQLCLTQED